MLQISLMVVPELCPEIKIRTARASPVTTLGLVGEMPGEAHHN